MRSSPFVQFNLESTRVRKHVVIRPHARKDCIYGTKPVDSLMRGIVDQGSTLLRPTELIAQGHAFQAVP